MKKEDDIIEIPFGAKDSELYEFKYTIPEGYEARIEDGKVIVQKKESEDERIRKFIKEELEFSLVSLDPTIAQEQGKEREKKLKGAIAWLERQKEHIQTEVEKKYVKTIKCLIDDFLRSNKREVDRWYYQNIYDWLDGRHIEQNYNKYTQNPAEWSEEDVKKLAKIRESKSGTLKTEMTFYRQGVRDAFNYKGFRPSWKPSEEQINALERAIIKMHTPDDIGILSELRDNLKKL